MGSNGPRIYRIGHGTVRLQVSNLYGRVEFQRMGSYGGEGRLAKSLVQFRRCLIFCDVVFCGSIEMIPVAG